MFPIRPVLAHRGFSGLADSDGDAVHVHECATPATGTPLAGARPPDREDTSADRFAVREATEHDNDSLVQLTKGEPAPTRGVRWAVEPSGDFFIRLRAEAGGWHVVVAEERATGLAVGCLSLSVREAYVDGSARTTGYVTNLLVRPGHRRRGVGDLLCWRAAELCRQHLGDNAPILLAMREGNDHMRGRISGPRGLPRLEAFGRFAIHSLRTRVLAARKGAVGVHTHSAHPRDLGEMAALGRDVFASRQFGPAVDSESLDRWIRGAPGLALSDYLLAREGSRIVGWLGLWDESVARRVTVAGRTPMAALRHRLGRALPGRGGGPAVGEEVRSAVAVHVCVPPERIDVLETLLTAAGRGLLHRDCGWLRIALDVRDPLRHALGPTSAAASHFGAHVTTASRWGSALPRLHLPVHFEAALA